MSDITNITLPTEWTILVDGKPEKTRDLLAISAYLDDVESRRLALSDVFGHKVSTVHFGCHGQAPDRCYELGVATKEGWSDEYGRQGMSEQTARVYHQNVVTDIRNRIFAGGRLNWRRAKKRYGIDGRYNKEGRAVKVRRFAFTTHQ